jgi:hypothetical protein
VPKLNYLSIVCHKMMTSQETPNVICPESTPESSNRRNFVRKAALASVLAGIGVTSIGKGIVPGSSASSNAIISCCVSDADVTTVHANADCIVVDSANQNPGSLSASRSIDYAVTFGTCLGCCSNIVHSGQGFASARACKAPNLKGLDLYTNYIKRISITNSGNVGIGTCDPSNALCVKGTVSGASVAGNGVVGCSTASGSSGVYGVGKTFGIAGKTSCPGGIAIHGRAANPCAIPFVAVGSCGQVANMQEWENAAGIPLSVVNKCGWLGIGTSSPSSALDVVGSASISGTLSAGTFSPSSISIPKGTISVSDCVASAIALSASSSASTGVGIQGSGGSVGVQGIAGSAMAFPIVAKGASCQSVCLQKWQVGCTIKSALNKCGWLGLGRPSAPTTLAVCGSVSAHVATPNGSYVMNKSDFAVLANGKVTLPSASTARGMIVFIKNISTGSITVEVSGSDKIEGKSSKALAKEYASLTLLSDGNSPGNWYILSSAT